MVDLGCIYMMFLKDLQYEKQKKREKQKSRKAKKEGTRNQKNMFKTEKINIPPQK
jgi:hypothetical protein